jgi:hypothetical protein
MHVMVYTHIHTIHTQCVCEGANARAYAQVSECVSECVSERQRETPATVSSPFSSTAPSAPSPASSAPTVTQRSASIASSILFRFWFRLGLGSGFSFMFRSRIHCVLLLEYDPHLSNAKTGWSGAARPPRRCTHERRATDGRWCGHLHGARVRAAVRAQVRARGNTHRSHVLRSIGQKFMFFIIFSQSCSWPFFKNKTKISAQVLRHAPVSWCCRRE